MLSQLLLYNFFRHLDLSVFIHFISMSLSFFIQKLLCNNYFRYCEAWEICSNHWHLDLNFTKVTDKKIENASPGLPDLGTVLWSVYTNRDSWQTNKLLLLFKFVLHHNLSIQLLYLYISAASHFYKILLFLQSLVCAIVCHAEHPQLTLLHPSPLGKHDKPRHVWYRDGLMVNLSCHGSRFLGQLAVHQPEPAGCKQNMKEYLYDALFWKCGLVLAHHFKTKNVTAITIIW